MRGALENEDVTFLIERMMRDSSHDVQVRAFNSLPSNYRSPSPLIVEQTRAMYEVAIDQVRPLNFRKVSARRALDNVRGAIDQRGKAALTEQEKRTLQTLQEEWGSKE